MNTATFKPRIASPYQQVPNKRHSFDISSASHPVRKELLRHVAKKIDLTVSFSEDTATVNMLNIPGLIAFICKIEQNGQVVALGRSNGLISENSRYFDNIIKSCRDYSLVDGISKLVRATDTLRANTSKPAYDYPKEAMLDDAIKTRDSYREEEMATEKQKKFLSELIHTNIRNEDERSLRESQISEFTRSEASRAIQSFQK